jgi:hypothetical protein
MLGVRPARQRCPSEEEPGFGRGPKYMEQVPHFSGKLCRAEMRVSSFAVIFLLMAIFMIVSVAWQVFSDEAVKTKSLFLVMLAGTIVTGFATLGLNIAVPD